MAGRLFCYIRQPSYELLVLLWERLLNQSRSVQVRKSGTSVNKNEVSISVRQSFLGKIVNNIIVHEMFNVSGNAYVLCRCKVSALQAWRAFENKQFNGLSMYCFNIYWPHSKSIRLDVCVCVPEGGGGVRKSCNSFVKSDTRTCDKGLVRRSLHDEST